MGFGLGFGLGWALQKVLPDPDPSRDPKPQAAQSKRSAGSGARGASSALQKHNAGIAEEQAALDGHLAELHGARTKRLELQLDATSMALRSDTLGQDRLKRDYVQAASASEHRPGPRPGPGPGPGPGPCP